MTELIVKFHEDVPEEVIDLILDNYDSNRVHSLHGLKFHKIEVPEDQSTEILSRLKADPAVKLAIRNSRVKAASFQPNDLWYTNTQWQHQMVRLPFAWDEVQGLPTQKIAIIDSGGNVFHEDFKDSDGVSRLVPGINTYNPATPDLITDPIGHGNNCASVIGATGNNGKGIAGANWYAKMTAYRICANNGLTYSYNIIAAIEHAADIGHRFANLSYELDEPSFTTEENLALIPVYQDAFDYAWDRGMLIFFCAANYNKDTGPGAVVQRAMRQCITVGATEKGLQKATYSNYGPWVTVVAPVGETLLATPTFRTSLASSATFTTCSYTANNTYGTDYFGGTSAATPLALGVASLGDAVAQKLTLYQLCALVKCSTRKVDARWHDQTASAFGMVDAKKTKDVAKLALPGASPRPTVIMATPKHNSSVYLGVNDTVLFEALVFDENPVQSVSLYVDGSETPFGTVTQEPFIIPWTPSGTGTHTFQLKATSASGTGSSATNTVVVLPATTGVAPFVAFTSHRQGDTVSRNFHLEAVASCHGVMPPEPVLTRYGSYPDPYLDKLDVVVKQGATTIATVPQFRVGGSFADITIPNNISGTITLQATAVTSDGMTATTSMDVTVAAVGTTGAFTAPAVTLRPVVSTPSITGVQRGSFSMPSVSLPPAVAAPSLTGVSATVSAGSFDLPSVTLRPIVAAPQLSGMTGGASIRAPSGQLLNLRRIDGTPLTILSI